MPSGDRIRVAVIGGGCGALAAAFELTKPEQKGRFEVTVYQLGWRLGGKGASGRGGPSKRIEEHALHVWLGFYENAFRLLREAHAELGHPDKWCEDFVEDSFVALANDTLMADGSVAAATPAAAWAALFPPTPGLPGDPFVGDANPFAVASYLRQAVRLLRSLMSGLAYLEKDPQRGFVDKDFADLDAGPDPNDQRTAVRRALDALLALWKVGYLSTTAGIVTSINLIEKLILEFADRARRQRSAEGPRGGADDEYIVTQFVTSFADSVRKQLGSVVQSDPKFALRWQIIDLVLAIMVGVVRDGLLTHPDGLDSINDVECRDWLRRHGASEAAVQGAFVNGLYHLGFAKDAGVAAGQALRGALRMFFTYRGAMFWKMRAGMGDVVFVPLFRALKGRGVRFEFFHRLENVGMEFPPDAAPFVASLDFDVQAEVPARLDYDPLEDVKGRACWMSQPPPVVSLAAKDGVPFAFESFYDRRKVATRTLRVGADFDVVVLGIGKGGIRYACRELLDGPGPVAEKWKAMHEKVPTVPTQSFQMWLRKDMSELGWHDQSVTLTGIPGHFDTWADMRQVVPAEDWPADAEPRTAAYFCGPLEPRPGDMPPEKPSGPFDLVHPQARLMEVRSNASEFLDTRMVQLWRGADAQGGFDWSLLVDGTNPQQIHRTADQGVNALYASANINPSDQYVLATPGSIKYRISPLDTGIANLTVAGDWTACGFTEGCVEAAVMSGKLASHAISRLPRLEDIVGYDHP